MTRSREQKRTLLLYDDKSRLNAGQSERRITQVFRENTIGRLTAYDSRSFSVANSISKIGHEIGRSSHIDNENSRSCVKADSDLTACEQAEKFGDSHKAILPHLEEMSKVSKIDVWITRKLTDFNRRRRMDACTTLLSKQRRFYCLNKVLTVDAKWCLYANVICKRQD